MLEFVSLVDQLAGWGLTREADVPEIVRGSQTYVEVMRLSDCHLSPIYIATPLIDTTAAVCEVNVFEPDVAKFAQEDQGPLILVAVQ